MIAVHLSQEEICDLIECLESAYEYCDGDSLPRGLGIHDDKISKLIEKLKTQIGNCHVRI